MPGFVRFVLFAAFVSAGLFLGENSFAYCRMRTCDESDPECKTSNKSGCVIEGADVAWRASPIPYRISAQGSSKLDDTQMRKAVRAAFAAWQNVDCEDGQTSLRFEEGEDIDDEKPEGISAAQAERRGIAPFGIYFRDDEWKGNDGGDALAATGLAFDAKKGTVSYADIEVNTVENDFVFDLDQDSKAYDLQAVLTHEVGHYIGLAHSKDADSIMVPTYCDSDDRCVADGTIGKRALGLDDIKAVCTLYPHNVKPAIPETANLSEIEGGTTAGCSTSGRGRGEWALSALLVPLAAVGLRRRRAVPVRAGR